ncbi:MAG: hypothetical protein HC807_06180 [Gammaproteobacteria bacterium]|nr:hypothetical protein [Gammaproteobacteria bacterium]
MYLDFLGRTVQIQWSYHAILMFVIWMALVPICILTIRYGKPKPTPHGIREKIKLTNVAWWWFHLHKYVLYIAIGLSVAGAAVAMTVSGGFSRSVHSLFGIAAVVLGCLQVVSTWLRGTHGGRYYYKARPDDPATWHGDHYSMTPRRRLFEAFHKIVGYFAGFFALGAVASGLVQYPMPALTVITLAIVILIIVACIVLEHQGRRHDTYRSVFGNDPDHPYNKARKDL